MKEPAPQRIVSLVPSLTESLFALGLGERVVGVTEFCVHPADALRSVPKVGGTKNADADRIASLQPDLVIANREENTLRVVRRLEAMGLRVLNHVVLNQVVVELPSVDEAQRISLALAEGGVCWAGVTRWRERPALRISVVSWRTTSRDVERSLAAIRDALDR